MASIRKRGDSYLLVVSMGHDLNGKRRAARQKTVKPPEDLTPKRREKGSTNRQSSLKRSVRRHR